MVAKTKDKVSSKKKRTTGQKVFLVIIILVVIGLIAGLGVMWYFSQQKGSNSVSTEKPEFTDPIYSILTGEEISDASLNSQPTYCVQIPNGNDGGRPQAGLHQAAVVFEAIAERGITRFAAVFQNPTISAIGPIRSLRPYYLEWDTPFDCTVVHAGGSDEALTALNRGGHRNLDESYTYMWREQSSRAWNNLFTSSKNLTQFNNDHGYTTSDIKAFPRYTPEETTEYLREKFACPEGEICETPVVGTIELRFGASPTFNPVYTYDPETNTYLRAYASGEPHLSYECAADLVEPNTTRQCGEAAQLTPSVVIAMVVQERNMSDGYHEDIRTTGSGSATIFQNGEAIEGTWHKSSQTSQIIFRDNAGDTIKLVPGQVWISAIPQYGTIIY